MAEFAQVAGAYGGGAQRFVDNNGEIIQSRFLQFLKRFVEEDEDDAMESQADSQMEPVYVQQINAMKDNEHTTLYVDFEHVKATDIHLAEGIQSNFYRYEPFLRKAVQNFIRDFDPEYIVDERGDKEFFVAFYHMELTLKIRDLRTERIGQLVSVTGTVTRTSEVRPELLYGTFRCSECGTDVMHVEQQFKFTEPKTCRNPVCNNRREWDLDTDRSKFVDWQKIRVQENADEIPPGSMPRSLDIVVRGQTVEIAKAGDKCIFTGTLIVLPDIAQISKGEGVSKYSQSGGRQQAGMTGVTGLKDLGVRDLTYRLAFLSSSVACDGRPFSATNGQEKLDGQEDVLASFTAEQQREIAEIKETKQLYRKMATSLAPNVFGHEDVKKGLLLMLLGGVHKRTKTGMSLRGDVNVCIVGDPSCAKSQFLKYITKLMPRCVYTSGKASSAAGLTATVARDPDTGEFCIEAGALMLADNGICCIDEFDKMDEKDQVAIHEAMEQQTISITKAGIQATLNARASILAAANPLYGRYDQSKTLRQNVTMSPPIMSRFDIFFVVVDAGDPDFDEKMAFHIINMHQGKQTSVVVDFTKEQIFRFIRFAKTVNPKISAPARETMVKCYSMLRAGDSMGNGGRSHRITVRQLESMIRLSEALARLYLDDQVRPEYVEEAYRLLKASIIRIETTPIDLGRLDSKVDKRKRAQAGEREKDGEATKTAETKTKKAKKVEGDGQVEGEDPAAAAAKEVEEEEYQITPEKFGKIKKQLALRLSQEEERTGEYGMKQGLLIAWYLENNVDTISDLDELAKERRLMNLVIQHLIANSGVLVLVGTDDGKGVEERLVGVHPNYTLP